MTPLRDIPEETGKFPFATDKHLIVPEIRSLATRFHASVLPELKPVGPEREGEVVARGTEPVLHDFEGP